MAMKISQQSKKIADAVSIGLVLVSISSFILSYHTLVIMAMDHGMPIWLAWLWPLSMDLFMIIGCLTVIRFKMLKQSTLYPWVVVVLTTLASIGFNIASVYHTGDVLTMTMYAVPPLTVFIALELLLLIIKIEQAAVKKPRRRPSRKPKVSTVSVEV